jgi:hypothetical protein
VQVLFELGWQSASFADKVAVVRNRGSHRSITLLPGDIHTPRWQALFHLYGLNEPPSIRAFIGGEIGSRLVLCEPEEIGASALKDMDGSDHRALLLG